MEAGRVTRKQRPRPLPSVVSGKLSPPHLLANQLVEHLLGPVLGFGRLIEISEGGDDLTPPLRQGDGCLGTRVLRNIAGFKEWELAAGSGSMLQQDFDGDIQVFIHAGPRLIELIQIGLVVSTQETLQTLELSVV